MAKHWCTMSCCLALVKQPFVPVVLVPACNRVISTNFTNKMGKLYLENIVTERLKDLPDTVGRVGHKAINIKTENHSFNKVVEKCNYASITCCSRCLPTPSGPVHPDE